MVNTRMTFVFRHPKFYRIPRDKEEARAQLKVPSSNSDQVISGANATAKVERAPDPGHKHQALSSKQQASTKLVNACIDQREPQAPSAKQQASSTKLQEKI